MNYDAMTLGNHEFNFGSDVFKVYSDRLPSRSCKPTSLKTGILRTCGRKWRYESSPMWKRQSVDDINVAILGIGNHRIPNYELPSNIPGLTFADPIIKTQELSTLLRPTNDVVIALTHIGFTENPKPAWKWMPTWTPTWLPTVTGLDAIIGGHSHTNPATGFGTYKYLPTHRRRCRMATRLLMTKPTATTTLWVRFMGLRADRRRRI